MKLWIFPHSHFCEKARWALDYKQVAYEPVAIIPGFHLRTVRKVAPKSAVPVLLGNDIVVQGADEIIDFLDRTYSERTLTPQDPAQRGACEHLERSMDSRLGVNLRRILYDCLLDHPQFIRGCFTHTMGMPKKLLLRVLSASTPTHLRYPCHFRCRCGESARRV
ncbi:MAG: glutathione S-transferase [Gammaproteobacteria bacterium]|jgi:glutathione S-transferase